MQIFVLKTNIESDKNINIVQSLMQMHPLVIDWHIDREDIDKVMRIEAQSNIKEEDIIHLLTQYGVASETLSN